MPTPRYQCGKCSRGACLESREKQFIRPEVVTAMVTNVVLGSSARVSSAANPRPVVFVVDDDISVRESIEVMMEEVGWRPVGYASAREFLSQTRSVCVCCLVLDLGLPDLNGLEVQQRILEEGAQMPVIFITGRGDVPTSVRAMKAGAVEFLLKPFEPAELLSAVEGALDRSRTRLQEMTSLQLAREHYATLSRREREVMERVVRGKLNKQIACELGISEITVKAHRGRMMRRMRARSLPDLVKLAGRLGLGCIDQI